VSARRHLKEQDLPAEKGLQPLHFFAPAEVEKRVQAYLRKINRRTSREERCGGLKPNYAKKLTQN
jgi:hypothetical protein